MSGLELPNEASVDANLLQPLLRSLNISSDRVVVQRTFRLHLGRQSHEYESRWISGRLDYLISDPDATSLFILELKHPAHPLNDDDRDQGISYARLVHPIAPFVVLYNGIQTRIFDTITREELLPTSIQDRAHTFWSGGLSPDAESWQIRYEALRAFLGYSSENVRKFCLQQHQHRMDLLRGSPGTLEGKYIPDVYIARRRLHELFDKFLASDSVAFTITGPSGIGKTNAMCALATRTGSEHVALFFNGTILHGPLKEYIAEEFAWTFTEDLRLPEILWRLDGIAKKLSRRVIVFIDAVDEIVQRGIEQELSDLVDRLRSYAGRIKVVVSAKTHEYNRFAQLGGSESALQRAAFGGHRINRRTDPSVHTHTQFDSPSEWASSALLVPFTEPERVQACDRYRTTFGLSGEFSPVLGSACADPFLLRMVSEVHTGGSVPLPSTADEVTLVRAYLQSKLDKIDPNLDPLRGLIAIARGLIGAQPRFEMNTPLGKWRSEPLRGRNIVSAISEDAVRGQREMVDIKTLRALVSHGILTQTMDTEHRKTLSFYYDRVRTYVIGLLVLELDRVEDLQSVLRDSMGIQLLEDVLQWYLRQCTDAEQVRSATTFIHRQTEIFCREYNHLRHVFPLLFRMNMSPHCGGPLGIAYWYDPGRWHRIAYFNQELGMPPVIADERLASDQRFTVRGKPRLLTTPGGSPGFWLARDPIYAARQALGEVIIEAIKEGGLDEHMSAYLLKETILGLTLSERKKLRYSSETTLTSWASEHLGLDLPPIDLAELQTTIQEHFGHAHYMARWRDQKEEEITKHRDPHNPADSTTLSYTIPAEVEHEAWTKAREEAARGTIFHPAGSYCLVELSRRVEFAKASGIQNLEIPLLPAPDLPPPYISPMYESGYSDQQLTRLLENLFTRALEEYRSLALHNFGTMVGEFQFLRQFPVAVVIECQRMPPERGQVSTARVSYGFVNLEEGPCVAEVHINPTECLYDFERSEIGSGSRYAGLNSGWTMSTLYSVLGLSRELRFGTNYCDASRYTPVRSLVYRFLRRDLEELTTLARCFGSAG